jgi:hypothetical protein
MREGGPPNTTTHIDQHYSPIPPPPPFAHLGIGVLAHSIAETQLVGRPSPECGRGTANRPVVHRHVLRGRGCVCVKQGCRRQQTSVEFKTRESGGGGGGGSWRESTTLKGPSHTKVRTHHVRGQKFKFGRTKSSPAKMNDAGRLRRLAARCSGTTNGTHNVEGLLHAWTTKPHKTTCRQRRQCRLPEHSPRRTGGGRTA